MSAPAPDKPVAFETHAYTVADLSVQPDGDDFLVGNATLGGFYQFPAEGVKILEWLRVGLSPAMVKARLVEAGEGAEKVDVDDFVATLVNIGFARPAGTAEQTVSDPVQDRRWRFAVDRCVAGAFFSPPALATYFTLVAAAVVCVVRNPAARPNLHAFYIDHYLAATLILLLLMSSFGTALHELGHLLAAAREGVASRLSIGTRLWNIVVEADLSGIMALPKRHRYLPLLAGILVDFLTIAATTLAIAWLNSHNANPFFVALLQALVLQTIITITWQFNIFLRTDIYYVLSTWKSYPDLDADARTYIGGKLNMLTGGYFGGADLSAPRSRMGTLRAFAAIWVLGRALSLATLVLIVLPTLAHYVTKAWQAFNDPAASGATQIDAGLFALVSLTLVAAGLILWLRPKFRQMIN